jgi:hypothetical protein
VLGITGTYVAQLTTYIPVSYRTDVTLAGVILAGVAAILARDSASTSDTKAGVSTGSTQKLAAWALIALLLPLPFIEGCSETKVAQDIVNWTPRLQSAVATIDTTAAILVPADAAIFAAATVGFDAASNLVVAEAKAYQANPSATILAQLQTAVTTLQQQVSTAVLSAAKITNVTSQQHALAALNVVATVVNTILSLVASISSKGAVAAMATASTVKLASVTPYLDQRHAATIIAIHYGETTGMGAVQLQAALEQGTRAGF